MLTQEAAQKCSSSDEMCWCAPYCSTRTWHPLLTKYSSPGISSKFQSSKEKHQVVPQFYEFISKVQRLTDSHRNDFFQMDLKEGKNMTETWPPSPESRRRCRRRRPRVITHATRERESGLLFYEDVLALQRPPTPIVAVNGCSDDSAK